MDEDSFSLMAEKRPTAEEGRADRTLTRPTASILTVGSEIVEGVRLDTNTREIAFALGSTGYRVRETVSVGDDLEAVADVLARLCSRDALVVVTGGLGPTHDDITREGAAQALGIALERDTAMHEWLTAAARRHTDPRAAEQVFRQADVLAGATVLAPVTGTAPGQVVATPAGRLALLPGPPAEMRPMLARLTGEIAPGPGRASMRQIGCTGITESDAQVAASRALSAHSGVGLTVLARPGDVQVLLFDDGAGESGLDAAAADVASAVGERVYSTDGSTLAEMTLSAARERGLTLAVAESCTGGMVAASLTDVAGASDVFVGGVVTYADSAKSALLGVPETTLARFGAVSGETASAMAVGAREVLGADVAVAVTGIAGPSGGTAEKPVGLVWFAIDSAFGSHAESRTFSGDRAAVRIRATAHALDLLRRAALSL